MPSLYILIYLWKRDLNSLLHSENNPKFGLSYLQISQKVITMEWVIVWQKTHKYNKGLFGCINQCYILKWLIYMMMKNVASHSQTFFKILEIENFPFEALNYFIKKYIHKLAIKVLFIYLLLLLYKLEICNDNLALW